MLDRASGDERFLVHSKDDRVTSALDVRADVGWNFDLTVPEVPHRHIINGTGKSSDLPDAKSRLHDVIVTLDR